MAGATEHGASHMQQSHQLSRANFHRHFHHDGPVTTSGTIYVLRSKSDNPWVVANRDVLHKIGVTSAKVETRIANAKLDPTFLMADVEIVATYALYNINRTKLENVIHRIFGPAQLDIEITEQFIS
jgi:hypothetical protein